jgi:uncharacterized membrane protein (UPF0127 family)
MTYILFFAALLVQLSSAIKLRGKPEAVAPSNQTTAYAVASYDCPASSRFRNDSTAQFFTSSRQPDDETWPIIKLEIPKTESEFMCGFANRKLKKDCVYCGYLFKWADPKIRSFFFRSVPFDSEIFLLDKMRQVIKIAASQAYGRTPVVTPEDMKYAIVLPAGAQANMTIAAGDAVRLGDLSGMFEGGALLLPDDKIGMHN